MEELFRPLYLGVDMTMSGDSCRRTVCSLKDDTEHSMNREREKRKPSKEGYNHEKERERGERKRERGREGEREGTIHVPSSMAVTWRAQ
jgi:hypothetical protein